MSSDNTEQNCPDILFVIPSLYYSAEKPETHALFLCCVFLGSNCGNSVYPISFHIAAFPIPFRNPLFSLFDIRIDKYIQTVFTVSEDIITAPPYDHTAFSVSQFFNNFILGKVDRIGRERLCPYIQRTVNNKIK